MRRALEVTARDRTTDGCGRYRSAVSDRHRGDDLDPKSVPGAEGLQDLDVTFPVATESVVVAHQQVPHAEPLPQHSRDELFRREPRERWRERHDGEVVDSRLGQNFAFLLSYGEEKRGGRGVHDLERVRIER